MCNIQLGQYMTTVLGKLPSGVFICTADPGMRFVYANQKMLDIFHCASYEELVEYSAGSFRNLIVSDDLYTMDAIEDILRKNCVEQASYPRMKLHCKNGEHQVLEIMRMFTHIREKEKCIFCMVVSEDRNKISMRNLTDRTTGLMGKTQFLSYVGQTLDHLANSSEAMNEKRGKIIYFNIRNLKNYNRKHGTEEGDNVLRYFSMLLRKFFQDSIISRFSDDHFVVFTLINSVEEKITMLHEEFELSYSSDGLLVKAGIKEVVNYDFEISILCDCAKVACDSIHDSLEEYRAYYHKEQSHKLEIEEYVIRNVENAIKRGFIEVYYQPIIRTLNGKVSGFEALARWNDPVKGLLPPAYFIPALETYDKITILDLHVLDKVCWQLKKQSEKDERYILPVSVNLSRKDILAGGIVTKIHGIVKKHGIPSKWICIELTESILLKNSALVSKTLDAFREKGYRVWMDDFGSGSASLRTLNNYQFDEIKLDRSFLFDQKERSKDILRSVISMAKNLKTETLAEGVETKEQYEFLRKIGCERVQGYYFGKPLPIGDALKNIQDRNMRMESIEESEYYREIGNVNFVTDKSIAIYELSENKIRVLYWNDAFMQIFASTGMQDMSKVQEMLNDEEDEQKVHFRNYLESIHHIGAVQQYDYTAGNQYIRLCIQKIAEMDDRSSFKVENINLTNEVDAVGASKIIFSNYMDDLFPDSMVAEKNLAY